MPTKSRGDAFRPSILDEFEPRAGDRRLLNEAAH
jgi:hypothetical protein